MSEPGGFGLCLDGQVSPDEIVDFVDRWHEAPEGLDLHDFLGMTKDEYALWVRVPEALRYILAARRDGKPLAAAVSAGLRDGERGEGPSSLRLREWLKAQGQLI